MFKQLFVSTVWGQKSEKTLPRTCFLCISFLHFDSYIDFLNSNDLRLDCVKWPVVVVVSSDWIFPKAFNSFCFCHWGCVCNGWYEACCLGTECMSPTPFSLFHSPSVKYTVWGACMLPPLVADCFMLLLDVHVFIFWWVIWRFRNSYTSLLTLSQILVGRCLCRN